MFENLQIRGPLHAASRAIAVTRTIVPLHGLVQNDVLDLGLSQLSLASHIAEEQLVDKKGAYKIS